MSGTKSSELFGSYMTAQNKSNTTAYGAPVASSRLHQKSLSSGLTTANATSSYRGTRAKITKSSTSVTLMALSVLLLLFREPLHIVIQQIGSIIITSTCIILLVINRPLHQPNRKFSVYCIASLILTALSAIASSVEVKRMVLGIWHGIAPIALSYSGYQIRLKRNEIDRLIDIIALSFAFALAIGTSTSLLTKGLSIDLKEVIQLPSDGAWARNFALACMVPLILCKTLSRKSIIPIGVAALLTLALVILNARMPLLAVLLCWALWIAMSRHLPAKLLLLLLIPIGIVAALHFTDISESYRKLYMYFSSDAIESISRSSLLYTSILISLEYFPFGSGLGTFASPVAAYMYSDLYYVYGLDTIHGLAPSAGTDGVDNFLVDIYAAQVIAEFGIVGAILFVLTLSCFYFRIGQRNRKRLVLTGAHKTLVACTYLTRGLLIILTLTAFTMPAMINPLFLASIILPLGIISRHRATNGHST